MTRTNIKRKNSDLLKSRPALKYPVLQSSQRFKQSRVMREDRDTTWDSWGQLGPLYECRSFTRGRASARETQSTVAPEIPPMEWRLNNEFRCLD
uniref:Secreted protein n=1 Tax=Parascaris univalens TaxID=6257 RepID=A0A914ZLB1_PARUN